jgi:hypothetical protein
VLCARSQTPFIGAQLPWEVRTSEASAGTAELCSDSE